MLFFLIFSADDIREGLDSGGHRPGLAQFSQAKLFCDWAEETYRVVLEFLHQPSQLPPSLDAHHPTPSVDDDNWQVLLSDPANLLSFTSSPSSSLASLNPLAFSPLPIPNNPTRNSFGILNSQFSLPPFNLDASRPVRDDDTVIYVPSEGPTSEEGEHGGFGSWALMGNHDGHRREAREKDDGQQAIMRTIGIYTSLSCCLSLFLILSTQVT